MTSHLEPDEPPASGAPAAPDPDSAAAALESFAATDLGNAERLIARYGRDLRYCPPVKSWFIWNGVVWLRAEEGAVVRLVSETVRATQRRALELPNDDRRTRFLKWSLASESFQRHVAALKLAQSHEGVAVAPADFDADPWLLNVRNGTIELRTGELREHRRADLCAKLAPVTFDPAATCPRFDRFLSEVFDDHAELISFMQRAAGYSATGSTREEVVLVLFGTGRNGKTKLIEILRHVLGDYARATPFDTFLRKRNDSGPRDDVADLVGARLVTASESPKGRTLDSAILKQLTGGDRVKARKLYGQLFEFDPGFTVWLATNHKPAVEDNSDGLWARIRLIPFSVQFLGDKADDQLLDKLRNEASGVLNWLIRGCLDWQQTGLGTSPEVSAATAAYRGAEDHVGAFIAEACDVGPDLRVPPSELSTAYRSWCTQADVQPLAAPALNKELRDRGFDQTRCGKGRTWNGLACKAEMFGDDVAAASPGSDATSMQLRQCCDCGAEIPADVAGCALCDSSVHDADVRP